MLSIYLLTCQSISLDVSCPAYWHTGAEPPVVQTERGGHVSPSPARAVHFDPSGPELGCASESLSSPSVCAIGRQYVSMSGSNGGAAA